MSTGKKKRSKKGKESLLSPGPARDALSSPAFHTPEPGSNAAGCDSFADSVVHHKLCKSLLAAADASLCYRQLDTDASPLFAAFRQLKQRSRSGSDRSDSDGDGDGDGDSDSDSGSEDEDDAAAERFSLLSDELHVAVTRQQDVLVNQLAPAVVQLRKLLQLCAQPMGLTLLSAQCAVNMAGQLLEQLRHDLQLRRRLLALLGQAPGLLDVAQVRLLTLALRHSAPRDATRVCAVECALRVAAGASAGDQQVLLLTATTLH